jgi:aromatic-amino-acid transaminase
MAYQGFGDGIDEDAFACARLADAGLSFFVANSFSKSILAVRRARRRAVVIVCRAPPRRSWCWASSRPPCAATTPARRPTAAIVARGADRRRAARQWEGDALTVPLA